VINARSNANYIFHAYHRKSVTAVVITVCLSNHKPSVRNI